MDKKYYIDVLTAHADEHRRPQEFALIDFMDFCLDLFSADAFLNDVNAFAKRVVAKMDEDLPFARLVFKWLCDVADAMERGEWLDAFGELYEELYLSRGKASHKGQFFTPRSVSDLVSGIIDNGKEDGEVNDCAAGSGRLLLSHFMERTKNDRNAGRRFRYLAQDSDPVACKMCALNLMVHGMNATVVCQDTLAMSAPSVVYHVNEVRYPIQTPYYSVRVELGKTDEKK